MPVSVSPSPGPDWPRTQPLPGGRTSCSYCGTTLKLNSGLSKYAPALQGSDVLHLSLNLSFNPEDDVIPLLVLLRPGLAPQFYSPWLHLVMSALL